MKRKDINDYISYKLWGETSSGYSFDCYINDYFVGNSAKMRKQANENDKIKIEVCAGKGWNRYYVRTIRFTIVNDQQAIKEYRKLNTKYFNSLRDSQRSKVYTAERMMKRMFGEPERLTPEQCQELANEIWLDYGFESEPPKVIVSNRKKNCSTSHAWLREIRLAAGWGQNKKTVLHEICHQIIDNGFKYPDPGHGKYFTSILLDLYEMYMGWNRESMLACFSTHKCKVAELDK